MAVKVFSRPVATVPLPKKFPVHSAIWNDVDMNCRSTPFNPRLVSVEDPTLATAATVSVKYAAATCPPELTLIVPE